MSSRKNILVIEPNPIHFELIKEKLSPLGKYILIHATGLSHALPLLKSKRYDLILSENFSNESFDENSRSNKFRLPWVTLIKSQAGLAPVIILTTSKDEKQMITAIKNGADDYFFKNRENLSQLKDLVSRMIQRKKKSKIPEALTLSAPPTLGNTFNLLSKNLKNITELINNSSQNLASNVRSNKQIQVLEKEMDKFRGMLKGIMH